MQRKCHNTPEIEASVRMTTRRPQFISGGIPTTVLSIYTKSLCFSVVLPFFADDIYGRGLVPHVIFSFVLSLKSEFWFSDSL